MRLEEQNHPKLFKGTLVSVRLLSSNLGYGQAPAQDQEVEQHITMQADGTVQLNAYEYGNGVEMPESRSLQMKLASEEIRPIFEQITQYFSRDYIQDNGVDAGEWNLILTNTEKSQVRFSGSLMPGCPKLEQLSNLIRKKMELPDLFLFDGRSQADRIERITLDHRWTNPQGKCADPESGSEHLVLDRLAGQLSYTRVRGNVRSCRTCQAEEAVGKMLDKLQAEGFLNKKSGYDFSQGEPEDLLLTVFYSEQQPEMRTGCWKQQKESLDLQRLTTAVNSFLAEYDRMEWLE